MALLIIDDHPNRDFDVAAARMPMQREYFSGGITSLIKLAVKAHRERPAGRHITAEIALENGRQRYHVSPNGRVWRGKTRDWTMETREAKKYSTIGRKAR